jgi:hypothetical protein
MPLFGRTWMRVCSGVPGVWQVGRRCLTLVVLLSVVASPGWAMPRFGRSGTYTVDGSPIGVRAAAVDSQSGRDLLTANEAGEEGPSLSFLFNRGSGSFFPEQRMGLSADKYILQSVAVGDFNADGRDDVAVAVDDVTTFPVHAAVLVYLNDGSGFAAPVTYALAGFFPQCIEAADVTGDGALDLIVCHSQNVSGSAQGLITVLEGQRTGATPNGTFLQGFRGTVGTSPTSIAVGDVDADGRADIVVVDPAEQRVLILYGTTGASHFGSPAELDMVTNPIAAAVDPVPGIALPNVLVASASGGRLLTYAQTASRTFATPTEARIALAPTGMALGKVDDDGINDLIVISGLGAELWVGQADGTFDFGESLTKDNTLDALTLADLNGDGKLDVAASASTQDRVTVVLNGADVPFTPSPTPTITPTPTRTGTPTRTLTPSPTLPGGSGTPTATRTPGGPDCAGDCDGNGSVGINELIQGVNIALGNAAASTCTAFDLDGNGQVSINELIAGVNSAQGGCAAAS